MGWWRRQPLRTQLVLIVVILGALALAAAGVAATTALRSYLQGQIDQQLLQVTRPDRGPMPLGPPPGDGGPDHDHRHDTERGFPGEFYAATILPSGGVEVLSRPYDAGSPDLTAVGSIPAGRPTTVPGDDGAWRIVGVPSADGSLVVGKSLALNMAQTLSGLCASSIGPKTHADDVREFRDALARFKHAGHDVIAFQVLDRDEEEFDFADAAPFEGLEGEAALRIDPRSLRAAYLEAFRSHQSAIERIARGMGFDYQRVSTHEWLGPTLAAFVARRNAVMKHKGR